MSEFKVIPENVYKLGEDLEDAIYEYSDSKLHREYLKADNELYDFYEKEDPLNEFKGNSPLEILAKYQNNKDKLNKYEKAANKTFNELINYLIENLINEKLLAFGIKLPRKENSKTIRIPIDVIKIGEINWDKSSIKGNDLEFVAVKVFEKEYLTNENSINKIEKRSKGRPSFKENIKEVYLELKENDQINYKESKANIYRLISKTVAKRNNIKEEIEDGFYKNLGYDAINKVIGKDVDKNQLTE